MLSTQLACVHGKSGASGQVVPRKLKVASPLALAKGEKAAGRAEIPVAKLHRCALDLGPAPLACLLQLPVMPAAQKRLAVNHL